MVLRDVTARVEAEELSRELESRLRRAQKSEALGRMAGGVAHDFNNLLTIVIGNASMLAQEDNLSDEVREQIEEIVEASLRASDVTHQLLSFGRKPEMGARSVNLGEVIEGMRRMLSRLLGGLVELVIELPPAPCFATMDPVQLERVIANFAINAQDAMPGGGRLTISLRHLTLSEEAASATSVSSGDWLQIDFTDTGEGMSEEIARRVFEPFFSTKGAAGTGLGLSTVQRIAQVAGGAVDVHSTPGGGTRFRLLLPPSDAPA